MMGEYTVHSYNRPGPIGLSGIVPFGIPAAVSSLPGIQVNGGEWKDIPPKDTPGEHYGVAAAGRSLAATYSPCRELTLINKAGGIFHPSFHRPGLFSLAWG